ncbi:MAG: hypothetical protein KDN05_04830 [Verrucomicrobiae bacterium]|nr:hypothetical protein [Verrucomicrobiae bacterium]
MKAIAFILGLLLPVLAAAEPLANGVSPLRWAVLNDTGEQAQNTSNLVMSGLSQDSEMVFVERDSINEIAKELQLDFLIEAGNSSGRARILQLMKADRLVVFSSGNANGKPLLRVVIAESAQGARLAQMDYPIDQEPDLVNRIIRLIRNANEHYANGIKAVVGIAPFTPENLEQGDDNLSTIYQELAQGELSLIPGVAVIETEEARAIAGEVAIGGGNVTPRITPVLIDGSFKTGKNDGMVSLNLRFTQGAQVLASIRKDMARSEVPAFFRKEVSSRALRNMVTTGNVSVDAQFQWLARRAEEFSKLGLFPRAAGLREAALLLKPDESRVRLSLVADYREIYSNLKVRMFTSPVPIAPPNSIPDNDQMSASVATYETALQHIHYLIVNRQVDREVAASLISENSAMKLILRFPYLYHVDANGKSVREGAEILVRAEDAEFAMHQKVLPLYFTLPVPATGIRLGMANFDNALMNSYIKRLDSAEKTLKQLDECIWYFNRWFPDDKWMSYGMATFIGADRRDWAGLSVIGDKRWLEFLDELSRSPKLRVRLLAEFGKIKFEVLKGEAMNVDKKAELASRIKKWWLATGQPLHWTNPQIFGEPVFEELRGILNRLEPPSPDRGGSGIADRPVKPADWQTNPSTWAYWGCPHMLGHLRFKELGIRTPDPLPRTLSYTKGDNRADFLWNESGIWRLDPKLGVSRIAADFAGPVQTVVWDGDHLWVLSGPKNGTSETSLAVFDGEGRRLAGLGPSGFSAHDASMRIIAIRKGMTCVIGTFRPYNRTWLAIATLTGGTINVNEFHHAKELPAATLNPMKFGNANLVFYPSWMQVMSLNPGHGDSLLIGRDRTTSEEKWHPLVIDMETLEVSVHPYRFGRGYANRNFVCHDGVIFAPNDCSVSIFPRLDVSNPSIRVDQDKIQSRQICEKLGSFFTQFVHQGHLHVIGDKWIRVDLATQKEEEVTLGYIPRKWSMRSYGSSDRMQWYGPSDNHGIIGCNNGKLFSVTFADEVIFAEDE